MCARKYIHEKILFLVGYFFFGFVLVVLLRSHSPTAVKAGRPINPFMTKLLLKG